MSQVILAMLAAQCGDYDMGFRCYEHDEFQVVQWVTALELMPYLVFKSELKVHCSAVSCYVQTLLPYVHTILPTVVLRTGQ